MQAVLPYSTVQHQKLPQNASRKDQLDFGLKREWLNQVINAHQALEKKSNELAETINPFLNGLLSKENEPSKLFPVLFHNARDILEKGFSFDVSKQTLRARILRAKNEGLNGLDFGKTESIKQIEEAAKRVKELTNRYRERPKDKRASVWTGIIWVAFIAFVPLGLTVITTVATAALAGLAIVLWNTLQAPKPFVVTAEEVQQCLIPIFNKPEEGKVLDVVYEVDELVVRSFPS